MTEERNLGQILFGSNYNERILQLAGKGDLTREEAIEICNAYQHPEIRDVIDSLKRQMENGAKHPMYNARLRYDKEDWNIDEQLLFRDDFVWNGFLSQFTYEILKKSLPKEYRLLDAQELFEFKLERII